MQTRSFVQRRSSSESQENPLAMRVQPRSWGTPQQENLQHNPSGVDTSKLDLFSHDPGPRPMPRLMPKLTVGAPNDVYEQEADRVAEQVMSMPDSSPQTPVQRDALPEEEDEIQTKPISASITPLVQRDELPEEEEPVQTKLIQRDELPEEEEPIQTKSELQRSSNGSMQAGDSIESRLTSSKGRGSPLSEDVRSFMEPRFGADFSQVRVHTGSEAVQMNRDLNAQAFAHKQDVYFGAGKFPRNDALTAMN